MPVGQLPQPLVPHVPLSGTQTCACVPSSATVSRQLSPVAQSLDAVQLWPQKSLPAYCTHVAALGQSAVMLQAVQVAPEPPAVHMPDPHDLPVPQATQAAACDPQAWSVVPSSQPLAPQQPTQLACEQCTLWSQALR
jgi:hypothetical protein